jgi:hypothetical protein
MFAAYLVVYSIGRAFIESIRIDPSEVFFGLRTNVWSAIFGIAIGIAIFVWSRKTHREPETSVYLPGRQPESVNLNGAPTEGETPDALESESTKAAHLDSKS